MSKKKLAMPCGKYKSVAFVDLPDEYLEWAILQPFWFEWVQTALWTEKHRRDNDEPVPEPEPPKVEYRVEYVYRDALAVPEEIRPIVIELFSAGLRGLAKKYHPDLDPTNARVMQDIVTTKHWLMDVFRLKEKE